jgi:hypothetical protein
MKRLIIAVAALALLAAACGADATDDTTTTTTQSPSTTSPPGTTTPRTGNADGVLLQVSYEGGFAPIEFIVNRIPAITLFADGTILTEGPQPAIFPAPALPNVQQSTVDQQTMDDIMELVEVIGLPDITEVRNTDAANFVADATDTVVRYFDDAGEHLFSVYALGLGSLPGEGGQQVPDEVLNLGLLVELLNNAAFGGASQPYEPTALQLVLLNEDQGFVDPEFANTLEWPFGELTVDDFASNGFIGCATLEGAAVGPAVEALAQANSVTAYELDGSEHRILARPLLPGETPCAMLES